MVKGRRETHEPSANHLSIPYYPISYTATNILLLRMEEKKMEKSTVKKISQVILMQGVKSVQFLPMSNQVWFTVKGHEETRTVVSLLEDLFKTEAGDDSHYSFLKEANKLSFTMYPKGLIFTIDGYPSEKDEAPTVMEAPKENTQSDYIPTLEVAQ